MIAARDAHQRVAAIDVVGAGRSPGSRRLRNRSRSRLCFGHCRALRNDQPLTRLQLARTAIAIGFQNLRGGYAISARQPVQRIAGSDNDRRAAVMIPAVPRRDRGGGLDRTRGRRIRTGTAPAPRHIRCLRIGVRRRDGRRRLRLIVGLGSIRGPRILLQLAALHRSRGRRGHRAGGLPLPAEAI